MDGDGPVLNLGACQSGQGGSDVGQCYFQQACRCATERREMDTILVVLCPVLLDTGLSLGRRRARIRCCAWLPDRRADEYAGRGYLHERSHATAIADRLPASGYDGNSRNHPVHRDR
jgi:hypothetical protein